MESTSKAVSVRMGSPRTVAGAIPARIGKIQGELLKSAAAPADAVISRAGNSILPIFRGADDLCGSSGTARTSDTNDVPSLSAEVDMDLPPLTRRTLLKGAAVAGGLLLASRVSAQGGPRRAPGWVEGKMTGAMGVVETLLQEGCECVYGIPGAQENELWDAMKSKGMPYLLCTHEFSASTMADGYARAKGKPGVLAVVPGPGVTNSLSGIGEALVDSVPLVAIVGDIAQGEKFRPFQVHCLDQVALLKPVTKGVFHVEHVSQIA